MFGVVCSHGVVRFGSCPSGCSCGGWRNGSRGRNGRTLLSFLGGFEKCGEFAAQSVGACSSYGILGDVGGVIHFTRCGGRYRGSVGSKDGVR